MDSSLKLFCSWVLLMTQPLRLLGNNSGNLSTATTPFTIAYMLVSSLDKKCHWHLALKKRLQGFLHNTVFDVKWGWKVRKKARLVHAKRALCLISVAVNQISNLSFMSPFQFFSSSVAGSRRKKVDFCNLPELYWQFNTTKWYRTANKYRTSFTKDLWLPDNVTYYSFLGWLEGGKETNTDDLLGIRYQKLVHFSLLSWCFGVECQVQFSLWLLDVLSWDCFVFTLLT